MKCPNCGFEITEPDVKFCPECGAPIPTESINISNNTHTQANSSTITDHPRKIPVMSIVALVFSLWRSFTLIGLVLAVIDLIRDKSKKFKHTLSFVAIFLSLLTLLGICIEGIFLANNNSSDIKNTSENNPGYVSEQIVDDSYKDIEVQPTKELNHSDESSKNGISDNVGATESIESVGSTLNSKEDGEKTYNKSLTYDTSEYIFYDVDSRYLTDDELNNLTPQQARMAINEIAARHGRLFKDDELNKYFTSKSWYNGYLDADHFDNYVFNHYENINTYRLVCIRDGSPLISLEEAIKNDETYIDAQPVATEGIYGLYYHEFNKSIEYVEIGRESDSEYSYMQIQTIFYNEEAEPEIKYYQLSNAGNGEWDVLNSNLEIYPAYDTYDSITILDKTYNSDTTYYRTGAQ